MNNSENSEQIKEKKADRHFAKPIEYSDETWRTDFTIGEKGSKAHGHLALSGTGVWFLREENGREIIVDGVIKKEEEDS